LIMKLAGGKAPPAPANFMVDATGGERVLPRSEGRAGAGNQFDPARLAGYVASLFVLRGAREIRGAGTPAVPTSRAGFVNGMPYQ
ncbi:hypothetical protein, partial [Micromonospora craterilacus]|uniref:hypothetical protein n=1 Tax=Micromonospora craterilacus TaxID=1655439 RepID=UPI001F224E49